MPEVSTVLKAIPLKILDATFSEFSPDEMFTNSKLKKRVVNQFDCSRKTYRPGTMCRRSESTFLPVYLKPLE